MNWDDDECIMLRPVSSIPRGVLVVVDQVAFDSRDLLSWITRSRYHPLTRKPLTDRLKRLCIKKSTTFFERELGPNKKKKKGFYSRKRVLKKIMITTPN